MANLSVTNVCNLNCPYCFAQAYLAGKEHDTAVSFISLADFEKRLDFLERSHIHEIRLIGGEPTLHPQFPDLIRLAHRRGKHIVLFTHGLMTERALTALESLSPDDCTVLVNMNATRAMNGPTETESKRRFETIQRLGPRVLPGFNIYRPDFQLDFLLPLIEETSCRRAIRLGLAQPILDSHNEYLHPKQYPFVGQKVAQFARRAAAQTVSLEFDCGFVRCMFTDDAIETLLQAKANFGWHCNPILDVDIDGQVFHCFPLSGQMRMPFAGTETTVLRQQFISQTNHYRLAGIFRECSTCPFKQSGECSGGCLASTMRRFRHSPVQLKVPLSLVDSAVKQFHPGQESLVPQ
jgi:radical SAM protein with 4Fe4S-binding SPASM domain